MLVKSLRKEVAFKRRGDARTALVTFQKSTFQREKKSEHVYRGGNQAPIQLERQIRGRKSLQYAAMGEFRGVPRRTLAGFARSVARRAAAGQRGDKSLGRGAPALLILAAARRGAADWSAADARTPASAIRFFQERADADAPAMTTPLSLSRTWLGHANARGDVQNSGG